jgi:hypothetical protein
MLSKMPAHVFAEWEWFFQLEPSGAMVEELRIGQLCALLANIKSSKNSKTFTPYDFLTTVHYQKPQQSAEDILGVLSGLMGTKRV